MKYAVSLERDELLRLDGFASAATQKVIDAAKAAWKIAMEFPQLTAEQSALVIAAREEALDKGRLIHQGISLTYCVVCKTNPGYAPRKRATRYHGKGTPDYNKPLSVPGVELADRFIRVRGHASLGACSVCFVNLKPALLAALNDVRAELPERLTGTPPRWRKFDKRVCSVCGWSGHEGEMGKLRTLLGDDTYYGQCPQCAARNEFGSEKIRSVDGFVVVEAVT